jgi:hypothetical protein
MLICSREANLQNAESAERGVHLRERKLLMQAPQDLLKSLYERRFHKSEADKQYLAVLRETGKRLTAIFNVCANESPNPEEICLTLAKGSHDRMFYGAFASYLYLLTRQLKPKVIVETGVERGTSTYSFLRAIRDNGLGELHSVDIRPGINKRLGLLAPVVPRALKKKWHYHEGNSKEVLPILLEELGSIDLFMHGSDHSYEVQGFEVRLAWNYLSEPRTCVIDRPDYEGNDYRVWNECLQMFRPRHTVLLPESTMDIETRFGVLFG